MGVDFQIFITYWPLLTCGSLYRPEYTYLEVGSSVWTLNSVQPGAKYMQCMYMYVRMWQWCVQMSPLINTVFPLNSDLHKSFPVLTKVHSLVHWKLYVHVCMCMCMCMCGRYFLIWFFMWLYLAHFFSNKQTSLFKILKNGQVTREVAW